MEINALPSLKVMLILAYIQNNSIIVENNDGTLYSKEVDSRVKVNSLTGSNNGDYIYFQIKCTNIFSDEDYNINIVIYNG